MLEIVHISIDEFEIKRTLRYGRKRSFISLNVIYGKWNGLYGGLTLLGGNLIISVRIGVSIGETSIAKKTNSHRVDYQEYCDTSEIVLVSILQKTAKPSEA